MKDLVNLINVDSKHEIHNKFINNLPFKHVVIDDFFKSEYCQKLLEEFPNFDEKLATNENGEVGRKAVHEHITDLGENFTKLDALVKNKEFIQLIETYTGIEGLHFDPHYFGGGTHNNLEGQDLDPHVDFTNHPITGEHRRLNLIVYLNHEWEKDWGGNIELHKNPRLEPDQDEIISVKPLFNRAVIFETNNISWHGFPRITLPEDKKHISRKSFALYYYSKERENKTQTHSTIYVERHLPQHIKVGVTLTEEDVQEIKTLLARRDQHLKRLYGYITELTGKTAGLKYKVLRFASRFFKLK